MAFDGVQTIVSASWTATRPADLQPSTEVEGNSVRVERKLINPGDMLELQVVSQGLPTSVSVAGRVTSLVIDERKALPYPPGSGREGEMLAFDRFMWFAFIPAGIVGAGIALAAGENLTPTSRWPIAGATVFVLGVYLRHTKFLVERRRLWRP